MELVKKSREHSFTKSQDTNNKDLSHRKPILKISPKFGSNNNEQKKFACHSTKHSISSKKLMRGKCIRKDKENITCSQPYSRRQAINTKHSNERNIKKEEIHSIVFEGAEEICKVKTNRVNKSCEYSKHKHSKFSSSNSRQTLKEHKQDGNIQHENKSKADTWKLTNEKNIHANKLELEIKKCKKGLLSHNQHKLINTLFEEVIAADPFYGKVLYQIKKYYDGQISLLNERVGRHDMKCKEYKKFMEKYKRQRDEKNYECRDIKEQLKKMTNYIETLSETIKQLKEHNQVDALNSEKFKGERVKLEKISVPPLDLSKIHHAPLVSRLNSSRDEEDNLSDERTHIKARSVTQAKHQTRKKESNDDISDILANLI